MFKQITSNINQATNLLISVAALGMLVTFGTLRLTNIANRPAADLETPSLRISPPGSSITPGQSIKLSSQSLGFKPHATVWLSSNDQITLSPVTGAVTTVTIPADTSAQIITITATATLDERSTIQDSVEINIK